MTPTHQTIRCPQCRVRIRIPAAAWGKVCRCPNSTCPGVILLDPILTPPLGEPYLTGPHRCPNHACPCPDITVRLGKRILECGHLSCRVTVSLFAALYFCPHCLEPSQLESPRWQWGQTMRCPFDAGHQLVVPNDNWLRYTEEGLSFGFACPACNGRLRCAAEHALGWAVCVHCQRAIQVPQGGDALEAAGDLTAPGPGGPTSRTCPGCCGQFPLGCTYCRICDRTLA